MGDRLPLLRSNCHRPGSRQVCVTGGGGSGMGNPHVAPRGQLGVTGISLSEWLMATIIGLHDEMIGLHWYMPREKNGRRRRARRAADSPLLSVEVFSSHCITHTLYNPPIYPI